MGSVPWITLTPRRAMTQGSRYVERAGLGRVGAPRSLTPIQVPGPGALRSHRRHADRYARPEFEALEAIPASCPPVSGTVASDRPRSR
jgi:hypothetical protein